MKEFLAPWHCAADPVLLTKDDGVVSMTNQGRLRKNEPREFLLSRVADGGTNAELMYWTRNCVRLAAKMQRDGLLTIAGKPPHRVAGLTEKGREELSKRRAADD